jgi:glycosyltransferase involved in cell wall biosynthesis
MRVGGGFFLPPAPPKGGSVRPVSIMMPCFNAQETLPMALASLLAQTEEDWEAVIVDDGSNDASWDLLNSVRDPRIKLHRFKENKGRGAARQQCLEMAQGSYLAFLDADDWWFPSKLRTQLACFEMHPRLTLVSSTVAIASMDGACIGVAPARQDADTMDRVQRLVRPAPLPFQIPPSLIRMSNAKKSGFNPAYLRGQDSDFTIRALLGGYYFQSARPLYAYTVDGASVDRTLKGYHYSIQCFQQYLADYPAAAARHIATYAGKSVALRLLALAGLEDRLFRTRFVSPSSQVVADLEEAASVVSDTAAAHGLSP